MDRAKVERTPYRKVYRRIKYPRLEFRTGQLTLILPEGYEDEKKLLEKHKNWILKKQRLIDRSIKASKKLHLNSGAFDFKLTVKNTTENFARELGVKINSIRFRQMKTRWASCGSNGNLTFNTRLRFLPEKLVRYVVFHEVAHRLEKKHNGRFYGIIRKKFRDMERKEEQLFSYWFLLHEKSKHKLEFANEHRN